MDFGDILNEWERRNPHPAKKHKGLNPETAEVGVRNEEPRPLRKVDPMTAWMRIHGIEDKDAAAGNSSHSRSDRRRRLLRKAPDAVLDIHGLTREDAWAALEAFFADARRQGFEKVLVVHGKGNHSEGEAVLRKASRDFIERCPFAGESGYADPASGGNGASWVLLKEAPGKTP